MWTRIPKISIQIIRWDSIQHLKSSIYLIPAFDTVVWQRTFNLRSTLSIIIIIMFNTVLLAAKLRHCRFGLMAPHLIQLLLWQWYWNATFDYTLNGAYAVQSANWGIRLEKLNYQMPVSRSLGDAFELGYSNGRKWGRYLTNSKFKGYTKEQIGNCACNENPLYTLS